LKGIAINAKGLKSREQTKPARQRIEFISANADGMEFVKVY